MYRTGVEGMDWIHLAQDWRLGDGLFVRKVMSNGMTVLQFL
jgi:hypothetical protein